MNKKSTVKKTANKIWSIDILLDKQKFLESEFHSIG